MKQVTLLFLRRDKEILLAMKKHGFGEGTWNSVGGKTALEGKKFKGTFWLDTKDKLQKWDIEEL